MNRLRKIVAATFTSFGAYVALFALGANGACSLIIGDLEPGIVVCTAGCGTTFSGGSAGFGGDAATGGGGQDQGGSGGETLSGGGGSGGEVVTGGGGSGGNGCDADHKSCDDDCVLIDDPAFGCGPSDCEPCVVPHAVASCVEGSCAIDTCDIDYDDCANGVDDGCETYLVDDPLHCGACGTVCDQEGQSGDCQAGKCNPGCGVDNVPVSTEGYSVCLTIKESEYSPGLTLAVGGQYTDSADQAVSVFPFPGCQAASVSTYQVVCDDLDLKPGTELRVLNGYVGPIFLCESSTFPSHCTGNVTLYRDGVKQGNSAEDPLDGADAPWSYVVGNVPSTYWMLRHPNGS